MNKFITLGLYYFLHKRSYYMQEEFRDYIQNKKLIEPGEKILLAVSGGIDSMVMLDLFRRSGLDIAIAHCNFQLRGIESDRDEHLIREVAARYGIPISTIRFDTEKEAAIYSESIQMAARRLRYDYFEELCLEKGYTKIAIAHHGADSIETFFINLMRGTGLRGLGGIPLRNGKIIRPLLFASRENIVSYASVNEIEFRNDASNETIKYLRNRLRHQILPLLHSASNSFPETMMANLERLEQTQRFVDSQIAMIRQRIEKEGRIDTRLLMQQAEPEFVLYEIMRPYGFSAEIISDLYCAIHEINSTGKRFISPDYEAIIDRESILITTCQRASFGEELIEENDSRIEWLTIDQLDSLATPPDVALLTADSLRFPLQLRRWQYGDWFIPLGMHGQKKISDYLIDAKVPLTEKEKQGVLVSGSEIVWLIGRRIDDRYKVTEKSAQVIKITLES